MGFKMNTKEILRRVDRTIKEFPDMIGVAVDSHVNNVFAETQIRVPKKTTTLQQTGQIKKNKTGKNRYSYSIWYGGGEVDYAAAVHEILKAEHAAPTGAKYVEQPLIESIGAARKLIKSAASKAKAVTFQ